MSHFIWILRHLKRNRHCDSAPEEVVPGKIYVYFRKYCVWNRNVNSFARKKTRSVCSLTENILAGWLLCSVLLFFGICALILFFWLSTNICSWFKRVTGGLLSFAVKVSLHLLKLLLLPLLLIPAWHKTTSQASWGLNNADPSSNTGGNIWGLRCRFFQSQSPGK